MRVCFFFQAEDGIRDIGVTGVQTCALPISIRSSRPAASGRASASAWTSPAASSRGTGARSPSTSLKARRCCGYVSRPEVADWHHDAVLLAVVVAASTAVASTRSRTAKAGAIADLLRRADPDELEPVTGWLAGEARQGRLGVGWRTLSRMVG